MTVENWEKGPPGVIVKSHDLLCPFSYLARVREDAGIRQEQVATLLSITGAAVSQFEMYSGERSAALLERHRGPWMSALLRLTENRKLRIETVLGRLDDMRAEAIFRELQACGYTVREITGCLGIGENHWYPRITPLEFLSHMREVGRWMLENRRRMIVIHAAKLNALLKEGSTNVEVPDSQRQVH